MYKLVSDINFDFARKVEFTPKDIADIYRIERQELDQGRSCPKAGFLIVTNVVVERIDEDNGVFRSTTLCLKRRKGKRFLLNRVEHLTRTGELHAYKYLFERE